MLPVMQTKSGLKCCLSTCAGALVILASVSKTKLPGHDCERSEARCLGPTLPGWDGLVVEMPVALSPGFASQASGIGAFTDTGYLYRGSTIAKIVAENTKEHPELFEEEVQMWVYEEEVVIDKNALCYEAAAAGDTKQKLSEVINKYHENVKYLPGIRLPSNVVANPSVTDAAKDSTILIFNLPHQFIGKVCDQLRGKILPFARGISCIKGINVTDDAVSLPSEWIGERLGIYVGALSGANIASEIAAEKFCETTIAYDPPPVDSSSTATPARSRSPAPGSGPNGQSAAEAAPELKVTPADVERQQHRDATGKPSKTRLTPLPAEYPPLDHDTFKTLFQRPYFLVQMTSDVAGVSLGGALKNVVALAAGFVDGMGWGNNTKAAIMRVGLMEMVRFGRQFFGETVVVGTFTEQSAGVADLITSCMGGRNFGCAKKAVERGVSVDEIEKTELNGQVLQGTSTARELNSFLKGRGLEDEYPLFTAVNGILEGRYQVKDIPELLRKADENS